MDQYQVKYVEDFIHKVQIGVGLHCNIVTFFFIPYSTNHWQRNKFTLNLIISFS
jgi:hypothetical protein